MIPAKRPDMFTTIIKTFPFILFLCCLSCEPKRDEQPAIEDPPIETNSKFDKNRWLVKKGEDYLYRNEMVDDLMRQPELKKYSKDEMTDLLGQPDRVDSLYLFYRIAQERLGPWPLHTKTLVIKLSGDSTLNKIMIHE